MKKLSFLIFAIPILLSSCSPSAQQQADYAVVQRAPVSPAVYDKMIHGDPLSVSDVAALGMARVNDAIVLRYIRDKETVYYLSPEDVNYLLKAGVSQSVVDYMVQTAPPPGSGGVYPLPIALGVQFGPFWHRWR